MACNLDCLIISSAFRGGNLLTCDLNCCDLDCLIKSSAFRDGKLLTSNRLLPGTLSLQLPGRAELDPGELLCIKVFLAPCSVHLVLAYDGRPTGSAFVEFLSPVDAQNAMVRDKAMMGSRYVELFHSSGEEVSHATG